MVIFTTRTFPLYYLLALSYCFMFAISFQLQRTSIPTIISSQPLPIIIQKNKKYTRIRRRKTTTSLKDTTSTSLQSSYYDEFNEFQVSNQFTSIQNELQKKQKQQQQFNNKRNNRLVWVIDDEDVIVDAVGSYLHSSGYQIQTFTNASLPIDLIHEYEHDSNRKNTNNDYGDYKNYDDHENDVSFTMKQNKKSIRIPDAIVCDILMPNITGLQFLSFIRSKPYTCKVPFIILTAKGSTEDRIKGYDTGTDGYLMKPFDPDELVALIDCVVDRRIFLDRDYEYYYHEQKFDYDEKDDDNNKDRIQRNDLGSYDDVEPVKMKELQNDLNEIKALLLEVNNIRRQNKSNDLKKLPSSLAPSPSHDETNQNENNTNLNKMPILNEKERQEQQQQLIEENKDEITISNDEMEVLKLLCDGYMNKEIANELRYSTRWVEAILTKLYRKTNCSNRTELVKWAISSGYVEII